jgi:methyltransferase-like protein
MAHQMALQQINAYDETPYVGQAFVQTHPNTLATVAKIFGMDPPPVRASRVLELGCATGANLIPMAHGLEQSRFVGIDLSARQIADAQRKASALGLTNITFEQRSILDINADFGEFDYIIAHGVYSWVPGPVQDKLLAVCKENLAPNGIAYVSYNTYPGWHMRGMVRDMMVYHTRNIPDALGRARQARALLDFLAQAEASEKTAYAMMLNEEIQHLRASDDSYILHEYLEDVNDPIYFHQFAERASAKGLQYLGEAEHTVMMASRFPAEVQKTLQSVAKNMVQMEQYMDFVRNRTFRQTLMCHHGVPLTRNLSPGVVRGFHIASPAKPVSATPDLRSGGPEQFRAPSGETLTTVTPLVKCAMGYLAEMWPEPVPFEKILATARDRSARSNQTGARDAELLGLEFLRYYLHNLVRFSVNVPPFLRTVGPCPTASPVARQEAVAGNVVTQLTHETIRLTDFERRLLLLLDGSRDRSAILDGLVELVRNGGLTVQEGDAPVEGEARLRVALADAVARTVPKLAHAYLLIS